MPQRQQNLVQLRENFKHEIFIMLRAFGYKNAQASSLLSKNQDMIESWVTASPKGPIVTAAVAARILMRKKGFGSDE